MKIRTSPIFPQSQPYLSRELSILWRELSETVNKHESGIVAVTAPASATATGTPGQIAYDASYIYICVAENTWIRASAATW